MKNKDEIHVECRKNLNPLIHENEIVRVDGLTLENQIKTEKYHADHIVQRLEAEKAELVEILKEVDELSTDYFRHEAIDVWNKVDSILQKHK